MAIELPRIIQKVTLQADSEAGVGRLTSALKDINKPLGEAQQGADRYSASARDSSKASDELSRSVRDTGGAFKGADTDVKRFDGSVKSSTASLRDHNRQQGELHRNLDKLADRVKVAAGGMTLFSESIKFLKFPAIISAIEPLIQGLNAAAAGAFSFISAIAPASGVLGALPGLIGTLGASLAVIKIGFGKDVTTAIKDAGKDAKKFEEDLKKLTPPARDFVKTIVSLKPVFTEIKTNVQGALFGGLKDAMLNIVKLAPVFNSVLVQTASAIGKVAKEFTAGISGSDTVRKIFSFGQGNAQELSRIGPILADLAKAFLNVGLAAQPMVSAIVDLAQRGAAFARSATETGLATGKMSEFFLRAVDKARELGRIISNTVVALVNMGKIANGGLGNGLLDSLEKLTRRFRDFTTSTKGEASLQSYFEKAKAPLHEMALLLGDVAKMFIRIGDQGNGSFAGLIARIRTDFLPIIEKILTSVGPGFLDGILNLAQSLLEIFGSLAGSSGPMVLFLQIITEFTQVLGFLIQHVPGVKQLVFALGALAAVNKALNVTGWITGLSSFGRALGETEGSALRLNGTLGKVGGVWSKFSSSAQTASALIAVAAHKESLAVDAAQAEKVAAYELAQAKIVAAQAEINAMDAEAALIAKADAAKYIAAQEAKAEAAEASAAVQKAAAQSTLATQKTQVAEYEATTARTAANTAQTGGFMASALTKVAPVLQGLTLAVGIGAVAWSLWANRTQRAKEATEAFKRTLDITKPFMDSITDATQKFLDKLNQGDDIGIINKSLQGFTISLKDFAEVAAGSEAAAVKLRTALVDVGATGGGITLKKQLQPTQAQKINLQKGDLVDVTQEDRNNVIKYGEEWAKANNIIISGNVGVLDSLRKLAQEGADQTKKKIDELAAEGKITEAQKNDIELRHIQNGLLVDAVGITKEVNDAISHTARQQEIANRTVEDAINLQQRINDGKRDFAGSVRQAQRANLDEVQSTRDLAKAQDDYNKKATPENLEALTKAQLDNADAHDRTVQSIQAVGDKYVETQATAREATDVNLTDQEKERLKIEDRIKAYENMRAFTAPGSPLRVALDGLISELHTNLDGHAYDSTVTIAGVPFAQGSLDALTGDLNAYDGQDYRASLVLDISQFQTAAATALGFLDSISGGKTIARPAAPAVKVGGKRAAGGPVQAHIPYLVGEQGPEIVTFDSPGQVFDAKTSKNFAQATGAGTSQMSAAVAAVGNAFAKTATQVADAYANVLATIQADRQYADQAKRTADAVNSVADAFANIGKSKTNSESADAQVGQIQNLAESTAATAAVLASQADAAEARAAAAHAEADALARAVPDRPTASGQRAATRAAEQAAIDAAAADDAAKLARQASDDAAQAAAKAVNDLTTAQQNAEQAAKDAAASQLQYQTSLADATSSILDQAAASVAMEEKNKELAGSQLTNVDKVNLHIAALQGLTATLAPDSDLRKNIDAYIAQLSSAIPAAQAADTANALLDQEKAMNNLYQATLDQIDAQNALNEAEGTSHKANDALAVAAAKVASTAKDKKATADDRKNAEEEYQRAIKDSVTAIKSSATAAVDMADKQAALEGRTLSTSEKIKIQTDELKKMEQGITNNGVLDAINKLIDALLAIPAKVTTVLETKHVDVNGSGDSGVTGGATYAPAPAPPSAADAKRMDLYLQALQTQKQIDDLKGSVHPGDPVDLNKILKLTNLNKQLSDLQARAGKLGTGGLVDAGRPYIVGDAGRPELFIPKVSGYMLPNIPSFSSAAGRQAWAGGAGGKDGPREAVHIDHAEFHDGADIDLLNSRAEFQLQRMMP